jgi:intein/homing endonuclease
MNVNELRRAHRARPFRAFRLRLADGREIPLTHPENLMVSSDGRCVAVYVPREGTEILDLPLVTAIDFRRKRSVS